MKICVIICEFNPFHNGHRYLLEQAKALSGCDAALCVMSGNFTQRGEAAILNKYVRAKHAVLGGADAVLALPAAFSVAPAEIFAAGTVKLALSVPEVDCVAFGCECGNARTIEHAARLLLNEDEKFKSFIKSELDRGESYIKSFNKAFISCGGEAGVLDKPNNLLAVEYVKSLVKAGFNGKIIAVRREGAAHDGEAYSGEFCSSKALRQGLVKDAARFVPDFVAEDLKSAKNLDVALGEAERLCLLRDGAEDIKMVYGCTEGLENALKARADLNKTEIVAEITGRRYSSSRVERIMCANLLKLYREDCEEYLNGALYLKPLAVKRGRADEMLAALGRSAYPLIVRGRDVPSLSPTAEKCLKSDMFADEIYGFISGEKQEYFTLLKV